MLYKLDHPFICQYIESFEDKKYMYIIMEFCPGTTLLNRLEKKGLFTEREAAQLMYKVIEGLNHIHVSDVVHRDIKPDNIMIGENGDPKIIDFGLSKDTQHNTRLLKSFVGSKVYMAPEILSGQCHSQTADMWSLGIIMFLVLSADFPFAARTLDDDILNAPIYFPDKEWSGVSLLCKDFILKLLERDSFARMTSSQALKHPWFDILKEDKTYHVEHCKTDQ